MNAIEIKDLNKTYKKTARNPEKIALKSVNLEIKKGSFFGLLGPNGAGKSTIINILAGLVNKTSGSVKIGGIDIDEDRQATKFKIGIVPQELIIDPFFNVYETLEIYAGYFGVKKADRRTDEIIEALGLKDKAKSAPRSLSGGMRRRLLVAKALVHNPEIFAPKKLDKFINEDEAKNKIFILCDESGQAQKASKVLPNIDFADREIVVLIGPEGGFAEIEFLQMKKMDNLYPISLGPRILRADTAMISALTLVQEFL